MSQDRGKGIAFTAYSFALIFTAIIVVWRSFHLWGTPEPDPGERLVATLNGGFYVVACYCFARCLEALVRLR